MAIQHRDGRPLDDLVLQGSDRERAARVRSLLVDRETSRFPYKERPHMPSSPTTPGRASTSVDVPVRVAFRNAKSVGARDEVIFAAQ